MSLERQSIQPGEPLPDLPANPPSPTEQWECYNCGRTTGEHFRCSCGKLVCENCGNDFQWSVGCCSNSCAGRYVTLLEIEKKVLGTALRDAKSDLRRILALQPTTADYPESFGVARQIAEQILDRLEGLRTKR